ncbi:extracellular solute-binding protein [Paenibacillus cellulositrophicus]|uniref:extracellular solute-binding protein n=1 Tax=Paenibacillus cellulositrophicus TaxID=562959 RepID=UPI002041F502|nr:extracellular solute-binding protein [Paenibacillus cellulositrophicus]MCM2997969.1 extracellular solute-binding protein [Paenibacillus cellulositrophicus]
MAKKWINMVAAVTMLIFVLSACSGGSKPSNEGAAPAAEPAPTGGAGAGSSTEQYGDTGGLKLPLVDKPTTIKFMLSSNSAKIGDDKLIVQELEKRTGIKVEFQTYSPQTYQDKLKVVVASGKLPDIFIGLKPAELKKIGQQKGVVAINEYADMLPNFSKLYLQENNWVIKSFGDEKGNIYTWPIYDLNRDVNHGFLYRKDIFDKNGIKEWTNTEEFYQALKKLKEIYPDSYPYASKGLANIFRDWSFGWGIGNGDNYPAYYDEKDGTWKYATVQPEHKDMLDFMKKLYNEGLMDPEFLTDTQDSWTTKMTTDKSFVTWDWIGRLDLFYNQVKDKNPDYDLRYANPVGPTGHVRTLPKVSDFSIAVANNKNKEAALKLLDYLTSPSGGELMTVGVEGVNFEWGQDGRPVYPELKDLPLVDIGVLEDRYGMWLEGAYLRPDKRSVYYKFSEKEQEAQDKIMKEDKREPMDPILNFTDDEISTLAELQTSLQKASEEFNAKYILDKSYGDAQFENFKKQIAKQGLDDLMKIYNDAQKRYDAAK